MKDRIELLQESQSMRTKAGRREALRAYDLSLVRGVLIRVAGDVPVTPAQKLAREMLDMLKLEEPSACLMKPRKYLGMWSCVLCNGRTRVWDHLPEEVLCVPCARAEAVRALNEAIESHEIDCDMDDQCVCRKEPS